MKRYTEEEMREFAEYMSVSSFSDVSTAGRMIKQLLDERRWIPVGERLPEDGVPVLLLFKNAQRIGKYYMGKFYSYGYKQEWSLSPTHWAPLPHPPEGKP